MSELTKKEQSEVLSKIKKDLKELGLKRKMRLNQEPEYERVSLEIADTKGEYSEDGYIINLEQFDSYVFLHGEYSNVHGFDMDCELSNIVEYLNNENIQ